MEPKFKFMRLNGYVNNISTSVCSVRNAASSYRSFNCGGASLYSHCEHYDSE